MTIVKFDGHNTRAFCINGSHVSVTTSEKAADAVRLIVGKTLSDKDGRTWYGEKHRKVIEAMRALEQALVEFEQS